MSQPATLEYSPLPPATPSRDEPHIVWLELLLVMAMVLVPALLRFGGSGAAAAATVRLPHHRPAYEILNECGYTLWRCVPVLYLIARSGRPWRVWHLPRPRWLDLAWALPLLLALEAINAFLLWAYASIYTGTWVSVLSPIGLLLRWRGMPPAGLFVSGFVDETLFQGGFLLVALFLLVRAREAVGWPGALLIPLVLGCIDILRAPHLALWHACVAALAVGWLLVSHRLWPLLIAVALLSLHWALLYR